MANMIELFKSYSPLLDEIYKNASLTSILDGANELARQGQNANEIVIPKISMDGLGEYARSSGYVSGDAKVEFETVKCNFDRGRMFQIDVLDDQETMGIAFGKLAAEFIRTKVVPELDAFRMATYAGVEGISTVDAAALDTATKLISALRVATNTMDEDEVDTQSRYLFITPTLYGLIQDQDTTKSAKVLERFAGIVQIPQSRFYTEITQYDGKTEGQTAGGYIRKVGANDINFLVVEKSAAIQFQKRVAPKIITPEANQDADAWKYGYRNVGIADAYENKISGIYLHKSTIVA
ncbi:MAG: hypothetical protein K0S76_1010 [Herbinix sp.]|jgi:hypothetical protein|nr:hypothetical protein [Herbinix sp.]